MDLSTRYLGLHLQNPFIAGASPLGHNLDSIRRIEDAGAAAIVLPSLFEEQIALEKRARETHIDAHNETFVEAASFLPTVDDFDRSCDDYLQLIAMAKQAVAIPIIASLNGITDGGWLSYAQLIERSGANALELNYYDLPSDPDEPGHFVEQRTLDLVRKLRTEIRIPLAIKLSPFFSSLPNFVQLLVSLGVNGVVIFNRFYQPDIDIEELDVKPHLELSSPSELRLRLRWLAILSARIQTSYAVTGGVHSATDAVRAIMAGADAVQMVSALLRYGPDHLRNVIAEFAEWLGAHDYESVAQLRGAMNLKHSPDPTGFERANYLRVLQGWQV
ncbi:MAG TPA: dihydroorotate dehydrogenase-like protein [Chthoniobacteraceae bacterium]|jgi:dihydroorotate dehydrogenase (fumarate)|nr:dihydroorotate dehydrogenase-like protein [Chthoniobacteraceae bacterium]